MQGLDNGITVVPAALIYIIYGYMLRCAILCKLCSSVGWWLSVCLQERSTGVPHNVGRSARGLPDVTKQLAAGTVFSPWPATTPSGHDTSGFAPSRHSHSRPQTRYSCIKLRKSQVRLATRNICIQKMYKKCLQTLREQYIILHTALIFYFCLILLVFLYFHLQVIVYILFRLLPLYYPVITNICLV